ncbi:venom allergen 5 isoform X2 [Parasteatoda tepidariorum]|uniref:venom allergen 5 isoform X2 n=1 Tax=Parasteatoda tepidariorum TaxID=114398 RepID=UPI0039BD2C15
MGHPILSIAIPLLLTFCWGSEAADSSSSVADLQRSPNRADCPNIYRRYSTMHSACQPKNTSCNIIRSQLTQQEIQQVLELHNSFRSVMATQQEESNGLPPAGDMMLMEWDHELAKVAQQYSDLCIYAHDKPDERRVRNFGTGQNIAFQRLTGYSLNPPTPDWSFAVGDWFEEIVYFSDDMVCNFPQPQPAQGEYRHFSQLIWSRSFRIGCGYTMYKTDNSYTRLYICNYGPTGNIYGGCVYDQSPACSKCPINTQCTSGSQYPGLCQRYNNQAPYQPIKVPHIFYCNFMNPNKPDCLINAYGASNWYIIPALGGNDLETVVQLGQNATIIFTKKISGTSDANAMCVQIRYRKGSNLAKVPQNSSIY